MWGYFFLFHWRCLFQIRDFHFVSIRRFYRIFNKINILIIIVVITISRACILCSLLRPHSLKRCNITFFLFIAMFPLVLYPADNISLEDTLTLLLMLSSLYKRSLRGMVKYQRMLITTTNRKTVKSHDLWTQIINEVSCFLFLISYNNI